MHYSKHARVQLRNVCLKRTCQGESGASLLCSNCNDREFGSLGRIHYAGIPESLLHSYLENTGVLLQVQHLAGVRWLEYEIDVTGMADIEREWRILRIFSFETVTSHVILPHPEYYDSIERLKIVSLGRPPNITSRRRARFAITASHQGNVALLANAALIP